MATDATGTPTPLGIPKINPAVDAPTGNGFNAAMDAIDTLISAAKKVAIKAAGTLIGTRTNINFIQGSGASVSVADNPGSDSVDVTIGATGTTSLKVDKNGTLVSTRGDVNLIEGANITLTVADNPGAGRADVTITGASAPASAIDVDKAGTLVGTRGKVNFIEGSNVTLTVADNPGAGRVDVTVAASVPASIPAGSIHSFGGSAAPAGYVLCDGASYDGTNGTYTPLWNAIGLAYGGTGQSSFKVPDAQGRMLTGKGTHGDVSTLGNNDGVLLASRRPRHAHTVTDPGHVHQAVSNGSLGWLSQATGGFNVGNTGQTLKGADAMASATTGISVGVSGVTDAPAYLVVNHIIKL